MTPSQMDFLVDEFLLEVKTACLLAESENLSDGDYWVRVKALTDLAPAAVTAVMDGHRAYFGDVVQRAGAL